MKRKLFIIYICSIVFFTACSNQSNIKEEADVISKSSDELVDTKSSDELVDIKSSENVTNTEAIGKIKSIIEQEQKEANLLDVCFYSDYMYLAVVKESSIYLEQYKLGNWEKQEVNTAITYQTGENMISLMPFESGIEVVNTLRGEAGHIYTMGHIYIYNDKLQQLHIYENISVNNTFDNDLLYVYEQGEQEGFIDNGVLYTLQETDEIKTTIRDFNTTVISGHEISALYKIYLSNDGRYIYFRCNYWNDEKTKTKDGWGILDLENSSNDVLYEEIKELRKSQNGIIVTDEQNINEPDTRRNKYDYFDNQNEKIVKHLKNKEESPVDLLSYEGNTILTQEVKKGIIRIYDLPSDTLLYEKTDTNLHWMYCADICEKYHIVLGLEMIHESNEEFSPTGKYNILIEQY